MNTLSDDIIIEKLTRLAGWIYNNKSLHKEFKLGNFVDAIDFINNIAKEAEKLDHHPDILLHSYNKVTITLSTHRRGGVTENDFKLADAIDALSVN